MAEKDSHGVGLAMRIDAGNLLLNDLMQERSKMGRDVGNYGKRQQKDQPAMGFLCNYIRWVRKVSKRAFVCLGQNQE